MKRFIFLISIFFFLGAFFHLEILGAGIRYAMKKGWGADFSCESLYWAEGGLVAEDLVLQHPCGRALVQKAALKIDWRTLPRKMRGHLQIDHPDLSVDAIPVWEEGNGWVDLTVNIVGGRCDWGGGLQFDLRQDQEGAELTLDWGDSMVRVIQRDGKIEAELNQFKGALLQSLCGAGKIKEAYITGRVVLSEEKELLSANVRVERFNGSLAGSSIREGEATFSYNASLGAKWEMKGWGGAQEREFPFTVAGKGFFNSHWIDSEIQFDRGICKLSGDGDWKVESIDLSSEHMAFIQAGLAIYWPVIGEWTLASGLLNGCGTFSQTGWTAQFEGQNLVLGKGDFTCRSDRMVGDLTQDGGSLVITSSDADLKMAGTWDDWNGEARFGSCHLTFSGGWDGEKIPIQMEKGIAGDLVFAGDGWIDPNFDLSFNLKGKWLMAQKELPLYCPNLSKRGLNWTFDVRCARSTWDLVRIAGTYDGQKVAYSELSHFLGAPLNFAPAPMGDLDVGAKLPWSRVLSLGPFLKESGFELPSTPVFEDTDVRFQYKSGKTDFFAKGALFQLHAEGVKEGWNIDLQSDLRLHAFVQKDGNVKGEAGWKNDLAAEFNGKIDSTLRCEFALSNFQFDLSLIHDPRLEGKLEGQGHLIYDGSIEADFDLTASSLKLHSHGVENEGKIHFYYSSLKGTLLKGINLHGPFDCIVDLLEYDQCRSHFIFHGAQVHLPGSFFSLPVSQFLDPDRDLNFKADLDFASDFSTFVCTMPEGAIPFNGALRSIENLHLVWDRGECRAALNYQNHFYRLQFHYDNQISGRLILGQEETPLTIDWDYANELAIHSIEGSFSGFEASFHEESPNQLIGSARINFTEFATLLPDLVAKGFNEIKMGKGFEVKGRLKMKHNAPHFHGILCGKQIELFGFQFRTLLGQLDYSLHRVRIFDTKISDTAGMLKIDEIVMQSLDQAPWTISIPTITLQELRPSLLQRPGGEPGTISPLVVRELKMTDFHGLLAEGDTYQAEGSLHFINSYKRGESVFDAPANVLSRIVGLDLELLIPVCGDVTFNLANGRFTLAELKNSYSEGNRSEFFLEMNPPPYMDLDWNLEIFIKMKQFVLLKFTESFLISIEGKLDDPEYHLQKRRFFGLL